MVSVGPPLQFYPAPIPITSSANGHNHNAHMNMRPTQAQFFSVNHGHNMMGNQHQVNHHHNPPNNGPQQLAVVTTAQGHPMNMGNMGMNGHPVMQSMPPVSHHSHSHPGGGHMVMSNPGMHPPGPQGQNGIMSGVNPNQPMMVGPNGMGQGSMGMMNNGRGPVGQPQVQIPLVLRDLQMC